MLFSLRTSSHGHIHVRRRKMRTRISRRTEAPCVGSAVPARHALFAMSKTQTDHSNRWTRDHSRDGTRIVPEYRLSYGTQQRPKKRIKAAHNRDVGRWGEWGWRSRSITQDGLQATRSSTQRSCTQIADQGAREQETGLRFSAGDRGSKTAQQRCGDVIIR